MIFEEEEKGRKKRMRKKKPLFYVHGWFCIPHYSF
jgi:hypothetical protein